jgi:hypothetical protein
MTRQLNTVLCRVCQQGRRSPTLRMPKHTITPWEQCVGSGGEAFLPEEGSHKIVIRTGLMSTPDGIQSFWRWACTCGQKGPCSLSQNIAEQRGAGHVTATEKRDGLRHRGSPGRSASGA